MKKVLVLFITCTALISLTGCGHQNKAAEENAQTVSSAFADGDYEKINEIIFGPHNPEVDDSLSDIWNESPQSQEGVLTSIFDMVTVEVKKTTDSKIIYTVKSPDMSMVFETLKMVEEDVTETELIEYIRNYAKNAELKTVTVSLEYLIVDDELIINYQDETFINAVTGGLFDAYRSLYQETLDMHSKE